MGLVADYEDRNWGFRFAEALMPKIANGIDLVWRPWQVHAENYEYELRHGFIPKKAGVVRLLAYTNYANMGIYREAVAQFEAGSVKTPDITNHPWHITRKYGFGVNVEQNLAPNLTAFARFGWDNGKTESFAYTEVDQTFATGLGAKRSALASPAGPRGRGDSDEWNLQGSSGVSAAGRLGISAGRWRTELRARKYFRDLLHGPCLARDLRRSRSAAS